MFLSPLSCDLGMDLQPPQAASGDWLGFLYDWAVPALAGRSFLLVVLSWPDQVPDGILGPRRRSGGAPDLLPPHCPPGRGRGRPEGLLGRLDSRQEAVPQGSPPSAQPLLQGRDGPLSERADNTTLHPDLTTIPLTS